ncbi:MAG: 2,3-bisphosphoglycerate-independent phosphoglycerate mutase [Bacteroidia bacterium]|nr:2,3-bisphosphoglycerate-independent phosphoglycerate mutase [Bacteroidia bacterium]
MGKKVALLILDGWGEAPDNASNAIAAADTPFMDSLYQNQQHAQLLTCGQHVGLPDGQMGNSEVGHMNIGAGRIVWQELARINREIDLGLIEKNKTLLSLFDYCKTNSKPLHLMGLVSDGGVHSHINHLFVLVKLAHTHGITTFIHAFTDGRDTDPKSGLGFINDLQQFINANNLQSKIASICGRYYAMDRDKRWERVAIAYNALVNAQGDLEIDAAQAIQKSYAAGITDEFIKPIIITDNNKPTATIKAHDAVLCFNFRTDRCREITQVLSQCNMPEFNMQTLPLYYVTFTRYDERFEGVEVIYEKDNLNLTLGEVIANANKTQVRIAETEKYPHVTFFFSGGREATFDKEQRIMIPSPKVATYDLAPQMSAPLITEAIVATIKTNAPDFICLNFANTDMVGHTGVFNAVMQAAQTVDTCTATVTNAAIENNYAVIIIADHGNADYMINDDGTPNTAHSLNPVPVFILNAGVTKISNGVLADVAPTILKLMGLSIPEEMTGKCLI